MSRRFVVVLSLVLVLVGCGSSKTEHPSSSASSSSSAKSSSSPTSVPPQPTDVVLTIRIADGKVTPTNAEWAAKIGEPITLNVTSDVVDEIHVHSVPDHSFEVKAEPNQTFQFTVDVPGNVEVELHKLDRTVGTVHVRP